MWRHFLFQDGEDDNASSLLARLSSKMTGAEIENFAHAARRRAVIAGVKPSLPHILLAINSSAEGIPLLPDNRPLSADERKRLACLLATAGDMAQTDIAKTLGVSRQMIHRYLRGGEDG